MEHCHICGGPSRTLAEDDDVGTETDQEKEYRLMWKFTNRHLDGNMLTPEEWEWLKRRGLVRY